MIFSKHSEESNTRSRKYLIACIIMILLNDTAVGFVHNKNGNVRIT